MPLMLQDINTGTDSISSNLDLGSGFSASRITINPQGTNLYVGTTNSGGTNYISIVDIASSSVSNRIPVDFLPTNMVINPLGTRLYLVDQASSRYSIVDLTNNTLTSTTTISEGSGFDNGNGGPWDIEIDSTGNKIYMAQGRLDKVWVVDTATNTNIGQIIVGRDPCGLRFNPSDTSKLYIVNGLSKTLSIVNITTNAVTATVPLVDSSCTLSFSQNGSRLFLPHKSSNLVASIDVSKNSVVNLTQVGRSPTDILVK